MEASSIWTAVRRSWPVVAACAVLGTGLGWTVTALTTPAYAAQTQLFVSAPWEGDTAQLEQGSAFSLARVQSYASIVTSRQVLAPVVRELELPTTPEALAARVHAEAPAETVLIDITVRDDDAPRAARTADAVAERVRTLVERLESSGGSGAPRGDDKSGQPQASSTPVRLGVTQRATPPASPVSPSPPLNLGVGAAGGLLLGVAGAVLRQTLDTTFTSADDLAAHLGLPVLGRIPLTRDITQAGGVAAAVAGHSGWAEAVRQLRTNLRFAQLGDRPRVVLVTSAVAGEGKTQTACALALSLAESGVRTCLVDADLRRPRVAAEFGLVPDAGLTTVLVEHADLDAVRQPVDDRLDVLAAGPVPPNPGELLGSARTEQLLTELAERYEAVVVDTAPLLPVADTVALAPFGQGVLLVAQARSTPRDRVDEAAQALRAVGARPLGTVLSMLPVPKRATYGYAYGYGDAPPPGPRADAAAGPVPAGVPEAPHAAVRSGLTDAPPPAG